MPCKSHLPYWCFRIILGSIMGESPLCGPQGIKEILWKNSFVNVQILKKAIAFLQLPIPTWSREKQGCDLEPNSYLTLLLVCVTLAKSCHLWASDTLSVKRVQRCWLCIKSDKPYGTPWGRCYQPQVQLIPWERTQSHDRIRCCFLDLPDALICHWMSPTLQARACHKTDSP